MNILMVNHFPLEGSGSGTYTKNIASSLAKLGHRVCIVMPENRKDFPELPGVELRPVYFAPEDGSPAPLDALPFNFPCFTTHPKSTQTFSGLTEEQRQMYLDAFEEAIELATKTFTPDIVHGQHVWMLSALAARLGYPLVLTAHGTDLMGYVKWPDLRAYAEEAMDHCKYVVAISHDNASLVKQAFPQHADKVVMMGNGYNSDVFFPAELDRSAELANYGVDYAGEQLVLFAGKLTQFKGVDVALEAARRYEAAGRKIMTVLAGDGTERVALERFAADLGLRNVHFIGNVNQEQLQRLYAIADVDIVPSRREPFGLVALEAMACGTPVVATNQGGLPDFVNDQVGALVEPEHPEQLAAAILATLERTSNDKSWRTSIAAYACEYSQDKIIGKLLDLYESAL